MKVKRIYPESKTGLINWIEQNFHNIDEFVCCFKLKEGSLMTVYDSYSYLTAVGMAEIAKDTIHHLSHNDGFVKKER
jgi:hypothetical protein